MRIFVYVFLLTLATLHAFGQNLPTYPIGLLRGANSFEGGSADSVGVKCKIVGVLYGDNSRASNGGITFSIRDASGSMGIFSNVTNFGLTLHEGDSVRAIGIVEGFNGLSQLTLDSIKVLGTNRPLKQPELVNSLGEATESKLVKLTGWTITNPAAWTGTGSGFTVTIKKGQDSLDLRIDNDCPWYSQPAPTGVLDIIGLGGQFDGTIPRDAGYQLLPRRLADIVPQGAILKAFFPALNQTAGENAGTTQIAVNLNIAQAAPFSVRIFTKGGSATIGQDFTFTNPTTVNFAAGQTTALFPITLLDDALPEVPEIINLVVRPVAGGSFSSIGADSVFALTITDNDGGSSLIPTRTIAQLRGNNSINGGLPDSMNVYCKVRGVVYGQNLRALSGGHQFTIRDGNAGIGLLATTTLINNLQEGDSVIVIGKVEHFNGYGQVRADSMRRLATNRPIKIPTTVTSLNEATESDLVRILGVSLAIPSQWTTGQGAGGFTVKLLKGTDTLEMRIDNDLALYNSPAPTGLFNVTGLGSQFDATSPYTSGYQIMPRITTDLQSVTANPSAVFPQSSVSATEGAGLIQFQVALQAPAATTTSTAIHVKGGTATIGSDFTLSQPMTINFAAGATTANVSVTVVDDAILESTETIILVLRSVNGSIVGNDSLFTITITDNDEPAAFIPTYTTAQIRGNNSVEGGVADSLNVICKVQGTLYGYNLRGINSGIQFTLRDATGGIAIFKSSSNFGLTLHEGDSVRAIGKVNQFNGLSQINLDSIVLLATGRPLKEPTEVTALSEATESDLVKMSGYQIVDPSQWTTGVSTGFTVKVANGNDTIDLRIDNDSELFNQAAPTAPIDYIVGLGGQFDGSVPRNSGYQLFPRSAADIKLIIANEIQQEATAFDIYPNPTTGIFHLSHAAGLSGVVIRNSMGREIMRSSRVDTHYPINLSGFPAGIYTVTLSTGVSKKIVVCR